MDLQIEKGKLKEYFSDKKNCRQLIIAGIITVFIAMIPTIANIPITYAEETSYWLELLLKTNYIDDARYQELDNACSQIRVMLVKSINTAKGDEQ